MFFFSLSLGRKYLVLPQEIVIDSSDTLYIADLGSLKIFVFSKAGVFLREILTDSGSIPSTPYLYIRKYENTKRRAADKKVTFLTFLTFFLFFPIFPF